MRSLAQVTVARKNFSLKEIGLIMNKRSFFANEANHSGEEVVPMQNSDGSRMFSLRTRENFKGGGILGLFLRIRIFCWMFPLVIRTSCPRYFPVLLKLFLIQLGSTR